jgi:hypothetical protein
MWWSNFRLSCVHWSLPSEVHKQTLILASKLENWYVFSFPQKNERQYFLIFLHLKFLFTLIEETNWEAIYSAISSQFRNICWKVARFMEKKLRKMKGCVILSVTYSMSQLSKAENWKNKTKSKTKFRSIRIGALWLAVTFQKCQTQFFYFFENSQIFFGRFLNFSQIFNLFFLLLFCFSLFCIKITHFIFFREKITAFEINSQIFDNRIIIDCVFLG